MERSRTTVLMKFLPLLLANLRRKKIRTTLTIGSFVVAFFLFGLLGAIAYGFRQGIDVAGADRLVVIGRTSIIQPLPLTYFERLKRLPGVKDVAHSTWFGGIYQDPKNFFAQFAIVPDDWLRMYPEFVVDEAQWSAFLADRQGCIVGRKLAERFGWKLGDHVPLQAPGYLGGGGWDFNVRGIYRGTRPNDDESQFWLRHDYLYEKAPPYWRGIVGWYVVRVANPDQATAIARAIDEEFGNSASETRTQTESAFAAAFVRQMGNIEFLLRAIGSIVFFTLLLVTGNTMAIAVRERTNELAVLKAIGYSDRFVLGLVLAESMLIAFVGGAVGLWLAHGVTTRDITQGLILLYLPATALVAGAGLALATGALAGLLPALGAMRLSVVDALRRV
jgi:putative ABC transport system permease protein